MTHIIKNRLLLEVPTKSVGLWMTEEDITKFAMDTDRAFDAILADYNAIAVAANQIGSQFRFFASRYDLLKYPHIKPLDLSKIKRFSITIYLNPSYQPIGDSVGVVVEEGCLSHHKTEKIHRWDRVCFQGHVLKIVDGRDTFESFSRVVSGFTAQIVQHEVDHLDGIMIYHRAAEYEGK